MEPVSEARHEKVLDEIVTDFRTQKNEKEFAKQEQEIKKSKHYRRRKWFAYISRSLLLLAVIYAVAVIAIEIRMIQHRPYFAYGLRTGNEYKLNECLRNMWKIRKAIDSFHSSYRRYPASMQELVDKGFLLSKLICPAGGSIYTMNKKAEDMVFECRDPYAHGVARVWAYVAGGPPVVEHDSVVSNERPTE